MTIIYTHTYIHILNLFSCLRCQCFFITSVFKTVLICVSFQPVLHDWCNKGRGMCYAVCGMVHIKEPLLLIDKSSLCGGSGFPFSRNHMSDSHCFALFHFGTFFLKLCLQIFFDCFK